MITAILILNGMLVFFTAIVSISMLKRQQRLYDEAEEKLNRARKMMVEAISVNNESLCKISEATQDMRRLSDESEKKLDTARKMMIETINENNKVAEAMKLLKFLSNEIKAYSENLNKRGEGS